MTLSTYPSMHMHRYSVSVTIPYQKIILFLKNFQIIGLLFAFFFKIHILKINLYNNMQPSKQPCLYLKTFMHDHVARKKFQKHSITSLYLYFEQNLGNIFIFLS